MSVEQDLLTYDMPRLLDRQTDKQTDGQIYFENSLTRDIDIAILSVRPSVTLPYCLAYQNTFFNVY